MSGAIVAKEGEGIKLRMTGEVWSLERRILTLDFKLWPRFGYHIG
jgi:hypothetical protein